MTEPAWTYTILISGQLGAGKTTLQKLLLKELRLRMPPSVVVIECNFADELKRECAKRAGVPAEVFYTEEGKKLYFPALRMTGRELLQTVGEAMRQQDPEYWVKRAKETIAAAGKRDDDPAGTSVRPVLAVVGDCRHPNEVDAMRPGVAIRLTGDPGGARARSNADMTHISETAMNGFERFDMRVNTDTTLPEMIVLDVFAKLAALDSERFGNLAAPLGASISITHGRRQQ